MQLAVNVGAEIRFDEQAETPWFAYTDGESPGAMRSGSRMRGAVLQNTGS